MLFGSSYYPERWHKEEWKKDALYMKDIGFTFIRTGEFAWSSFEPEEGNYDFKWMDEAVKLFKSYGLKVILCTPTAAPPPWLTSKHPDILPETMEGKPFVPGERRHYCFNSLVYREHSYRIAAEMAKHYAENDNVIGWQIDNEFGGEEFICCCDNCENAFQKWLKSKYKTVGELNKCWGGIFFSFEFTDWSEVNVPHGHNTKFLNPSFKKDYLLFCSDSMRDYIRLQFEALRKYIPTKTPVTTNRFSLFWGDLWYDHAMDKELDVVSFDNYDLEPSLAAFHHDYYRSIKPERPYWVLEQGCGINDIWTDPKELLLQTIQTAARGAELVCYFSWRQINYGVEQDLYGAVLANGSPGDAFSSLKSACTWLNGEGSVISQMERHNEVAIVFSYESSVTWQTNHLISHVKYVSEMYETFYTPSFELGLGVDFIREFQNLSRYKLVLIPMHIVETPGAVETLEEYVKSGGIVIITGDFMLKTQNNHRIYGEKINRMNSLFGIEHEKLLYITGDKPTAVKLEACKCAEEKEYSMHGYYNRFSVKNTEDLTVKARVTFPDIHAGSPAAIERKIGNGKLLLIAGLPSAQWVKHELKHLAADAGIKTFEMLENTEIIKLFRKDGKSGAYVIINKQNKTLNMDIGDDKISIPAMDYRFVEI